MRIIREPKVVTLAETKLNEGLDLDEFTDNFDFLGRDEIGWPTVSNGDAVPEVAGRVCYHSFAKPRPGGNAAYLNNILSEGHGSVLEHSSVTFLITGVSRSLTHELIRHRAGTGFSELSQRYYEPNDDNIGFVLPPLAIGNRDLETELEASYRAAFDRYKTVYEYAASEARKFAPQDADDSSKRKSITLIRKRAREAARAVLPNAIETHIVMTGNLRAWRNVIEQRGSIHADLEIRRLAVELARTLKVVAPSAFQDVEVAMLSDDRAGVFVKYRKV